MKSKWVYLILLFFSFTLQAQNQSIDLQGIWRFGIDREDKGIKEKWFSKTLRDEITLPGSMTENRKGDEVSLHTLWTASIYDSSFFYNPPLERFRIQQNLKLPFGLTLVKYYVGGAWYQKEVEIPAGWNAIVGKIELRTTPSAYIDDIQVYPVLAERKAVVRMRPPHTVDLSVVEDITRKEGKRLNTRYLRGSL